MADPCCNNFGGRIYVDVGGVRLSPAEGDIQIMPTNLVRSAMSNQDGSLAVQSKPKPYGANITFRKPCGSDWRTKFFGCRADITIVEESNNRSHLFSRAVLVGDPVVNLTSGEVSGITIASEEYQEV
jgi:hypothetical protein